MDLTATQISVKELERDRDERHLHAYVERFVKKWAPKDRDENAEFHADFISVVQVIHRDASRPFGAMLEKAMMAMPSWPITVPK